MTDSDTPSARQTLVVSAKTSPPWIRDVDSLLVALKARLNASLWIATIASIAFHGCCCC